MTSVAFIDTFGTAQDFFSWALPQRFRVDIVVPTDNPDILIFGDRNFGNKNEGLKARKRIFYTGENARYRDYDCDHALTFDHENSPRHYRLPLYVLEYYKFKNMGVYGEDYRDILADPSGYDWEKFWQQKNFTFSYLQSNPNCIFRHNFVLGMMQEGADIRSGGPHLLNIDHPIPREPWYEKPDFIRNSFFNIAFENGAHPGYCTEKIFDSYFSFTVPLYWGSATVKRDFNHESFIDLMNFKYDNSIDLEEVLKYCDNLSKDKNRYCDILSKRPVIHSAYFDIDLMLDWFENFVES